MPEQDDRAPVAVAPEPEFSEAEIDENLEETFPASDAPSWTLGCTRRQPKRIRPPGA